MTTAPRSEDGRRKSLSSSSKRTLSPAETVGGAPEVDTTAAAPAGGTGPPVEASASSSQQLDVSPARKKRRRSGGGSTSLNFGAAMGKGVIASARRGSITATIPSIMRKSARRKSRSVFTEQVQQVLASKELNVVRERTQDKKSPVSLAQASKKESGAPTLFYPAVMVESKPGASETETDGPKPSELADDEKAGPEGGAEAELQSSSIRSSAPPSASPTASALREITEDKYHGQARATAAEAPPAAADRSSDRSSPRQQVDLQEEEPTIELEFEDDRSEDALSAKDLAQADADTDRIRQPPQAMPPPELPTETTPPKTLSGRRYVANTLQYKLKVSRSPRRCWHPKSGLGKVGAASKSGRYSSRLWAAALGF